jgi:hypothetical protein
MRKNICALLLLALLIAGCSSKHIGAPATPVPVASNKIYVAITGSDAGKGTLDAPYRSIQSAIDKMKPGDTLLVRQGVYHEKLYFFKSGQQDKWMTIQAYPGEQPVIDGTGLSISGKEALVTMRNVSFILFEGFDICNYKSTTPWVNINGVVIDQASTNITLRKNKVYNIEHNVKAEDGRSGHGIEVLGNASSPIKKILIEENEIHDCNTGYSENLTINGYVDGFIIRKNKIYNTENIGIDAAGGYAANPNPAFNYARNGVVSENELYNIDMTTGPVGAIHGHGAIAIYVDGARHIIVERNKIYNADRGIGIVSETDNFPTEHCIVRNNLVYNSWRTGIYLGGYMNYTTGGTNHCFVVNNTVLLNNREKGAFGEVEGEIRLSENCNNNLIANNIVVAREGGVYVHKYTATGSNNRIDYNLYYTAGSAQWIWEGKPFTDFADWKTAINGDAGSTVEQDPLLLNPGIPDPRISNQSPACKTGELLTAEVAGDVDFIGGSRFSGTSVSKGAHEPK